MSITTKQALALIGENANADIKKALSNQGLDVIILPADNRHAPQVSSHADMLLFVLDNTVFCNEAYYKNHQLIFDKIKEYGYQINSSEFNISSKYPNDVALNQAVIAKNIFGLSKSCAKSILDCANKQGYEYHSIKQGYTKCSTLILGDKGIISADSTIINTAKKLGISTLKIENSPEEIVLNGYDYGFIGGASAVYEKTVFFFGNIMLHSQGREIVKFCRDNGFETVSLSQTRLCDIGGAIILPYINAK